MKELEFYLKALELKDEKRTGWELRNIEDPESVADHSWGTALMVMIHAEEEDVETEKCLKMALVHDLAEAVTGDFVTRADAEAQQIDKKEKRVLEEDALQQLTDSLEKEEVRELWEEYDNRETLEAKFVKDMDILEIALQALKYEKEGRYDPEEDNQNFGEYEHLDEFFATSEPRLSTETGKQIFQEIKERYKEAKQE